MSKEFLSLDDIIQMTQQVGESWAVAHAKRLIELVKQISMDFPYDSHVMELAAYMHDWGAFASYAQKDVEHAVRSRQVVDAEILPRLDLPTDQQAILLETIELHDYRDMRVPKSNEALLLREADMLEFLGAIGLAREFARGPKNVETCYKRILSRRDGIRGRFSLPRAQEIAQIRFERMNVFLKELGEESLGVM
jgi:HD superfamily phosphodiesterase